MADEQRRPRAATRREHRITCIPDTYLQYQYISTLVKIPLLPLLYSYGTKSNTHQYYIAAQRKYIYYILYHKEDTLLLLNIHSCGTGRYVRVSVRVEKTIVYKSNRRSSTNKTECLMMLVDHGRTYKKEALDHHIVGERCSVHHAHGVNGTAIPAKKTFGWQSSGYIDRKGSPPRGK